MKQISFRYLHLLIYILLGLLAVFSTPHHSLAQNGDCDTLDPRYKAAIYFYDRNGNRWGAAGSACNPSNRQGVSATRVANGGLESIYASCADDSNRLAGGGFVARTWRCPGAPWPISFNIEMPSPFTCSNSTWRYLDFSGGNGQPSTPNPPTGTGCTVTVPYPPEDWQRQVIVTMNLPDPPKLSTTCNSNGTVTLTWNGVSGATDYAWRLNNRANIWYTSTTDTFGYTAALTTTQPIAYGASYEWTVTASSAPGNHQAPFVAWSSPFTCNAPTSTPVPPTPTLTPTPTGAATCTDTDGGNQPDVAGNTVSSTDGNSYDNCAGNSLTEYYCNGNRPASTVHQCPYQCSGRRCVPQPAPIACGTVSNLTSPASTSFSLRLNGMSTNTAYCDLSINNGPLTDLDFIYGTYPNNYCYLSSSAPIGIFTYRARINDTVGGFSTCATGSVCGDRTAPPPPGPVAPPISCSYAGVDINGVNTYDVTYSINAASDIGCAGMGTGTDTPYWIQLSNDGAVTGTGSFTTAQNSDNTWESNPAGLTSSLSKVVEETTIHAHARARDDADNRSAWSGDSSRLLNAGNCTGVPTVTPTPTNTPIPTPEYWFKLKDSSLNKIFTDSDTTERVPATPSRFSDTDPDDTTAGQMIIGQAGMATSNFTGTITGGGILSEKGWYNPNYSLNNPYLKDSTSLNYFKNTLITSKDIKTMTANDISQAEANKVNIRELGDLTISNSADLPSDPSVIFVDGDITLSISGAAPYRFNQANRSIALIATGTIYIDQKYTEVTGIFIAPQVVLTSPGLMGPSQPALKINGNIISTSRVDTAIRQSTNQNRPSFFVVFKPKMYLDLLPLLSTVVQEGRQLE